MSINLSTALYSRLDSEFPGWERRRVQASSIATNSFSGVLVQSEVTSKAYIIKEVDLFKRVIKAYDINEGKSTWINENKLPNLVLTDEECLSLDELDGI
jgi:hypothetical protein